MHFIKPSVIKKVLDLYTHNDNYIDTRDLKKLFEPYADEGYFYNYDIEFVKKCEFIKTDNLFIDGNKIEVQSVETIVKKKC